MILYLKNGSGIHIKKKNRGKFTSYCGGNVTSACIAKAKRSGNPTLVKRATFAANARKWKHQQGGQFKRSNLSLGLTFKAEFPFLYAVGKAVDPTGISGYSDVKEADAKWAKNPSLYNGYNVAMETAGALPIISTGSRIWRFLQGLVTGRGFIKDYKEAAALGKLYDNELIIDYFDNTVKPRKEFEEHRHHVSYTDANHLPDPELAHSGMKPGQIIKDYDYKYKNNYLYKKYVKHLQGGHIVRTGDNLWKISRLHGISLLELRNLNPHIKGDLIRPGDVLRTTPQYKNEVVDIRAERTKEAGLDSLGAIRGFRHQGNYVLVDKKNNTLTVFDKNNKLLFLTKDISTGKSGNDYNTITYVDSRGVIRNNAGNNSTPAGITFITGKGKYHGFTSFTRGRLGNDGKTEDIASSFHWGNTSDKKASNGCVRVNGKALDQLSKYIDQGTPVYTLPEKEGSGFTLRNGKLNFTATNPYGETKGSKKYWDDYNVRIDKSYSPLTIYYNGNNTDATYNGNVLSFTNSLSANKRALQKRFNLSSDEYNRLAELAVGIAELESKYGTSKRYKAKSYMPDWMISAIRGKGSARSRGMSQIKIKGDNKEMLAIYSLLGITPDSINKPETSALATMARLAYMYNSEVKGRNFKGVRNSLIDPYDALLYKYMGRNTELTGRTATPQLNNYINNVKNYAKNFEFLEERRVRV